MQPGPTLFARYAKKVLQSGDGSWLILTPSSTASNIHSQSTGAAERSLQTILILDDMWVTKPSPSKKLKVLGHGLRINGTINPSSSSVSFPNAVEDWAGSPLVVRERIMIGCMNVLTDKPDWPRKIQDPVIVEKWRMEMNGTSESSHHESQEAADEAADESDRGENTNDELMADDDFDDGDSDNSSSFGPETYGGFSDKMFDYCLEEMAAYAQQLENEGFFPAIDATAIVYKSDTLIPNKLKLGLRSAVTSLEDVSPTQRDWHPGSDEKVLDLVHPSLFPLLYGRSKILSDRLVLLGQFDEYFSMGETVDIPAPEDLISKAGLDQYWAIPKDLYSSRFQWLPCEVAFANNEEVRITSYINNLHPVHFRPLYVEIENFLARVVPMWDATLSSTTSQRRPCRIEFSGRDYLLPKVPERTRASNEDDMDKEEVLDLDTDYRRAWIRDNVIQPEPVSYTKRRDFELQTNGSKSVNLRNQYSESGLQVIVKLANIHLSPEKPSYEGGAWHVEGQLNEHICATALYYYDSDNVTDSYLGFRENMQVSTVESIEYLQDEFQYLEKLYDIENEGPAVQHLGAVKTPEGRVLTFPNVFQHQVQPFELADPTRPGHRKLLALFLVDPTQRIPSTANVPPQQMEWFREMVLKIDRKDRLPTELVEKIVDDVGDLPFDLEEAKRLRLELMAERSVYDEKVDERFNAGAFSFCEH